MKKNNFPNKIPIFPLSSAIFFPRTILPLNIFEDRYIQLVNDAMKENRMFGMVQPKSRKGSSPEVYKIGCLGKIISFNETKDKRFIISLSGIIRFKIKNEIKKEKLYRSFEVDYSEFLNDLEEENQMINYDKEDLLKKENFENAIMVNGAIGGSTNAVVHMLAIAGRMGINITLDDWDRLGRDIPCLVNLMPSGEYLMEDFFYAGGLPAVIRELEHWINKNAMTANGNTIWENCKDAECYNRDVIFSSTNPFKPNGGIAVLKGNLAPDGAIIKPSAASPDLMVHRGRAVVFESIEQYHKGIDD